MRNVKKTSLKILTFETIWRSRIIAGYVFAGLLLSCLVGCTSNHKSAEFLFVQTAHRVSFDNDRMTLHGVSPTTLFFSDRPKRITGHQGTRIFVENWSEGDDSFAKDPPNASLVILGDEDTEVAEIVVELKNPKSADDNLSYAVTVLDGKMPSSGGTSALFIDVIGRPLTPLSGAGVARRTSRRVSRRR